MPRVPLPLLLPALSVLAFGSVHAQDPVLVDPAHYRLEFENDRVRVLRIRYGSGEGSVMHLHKPYVGVFLTDGSARFELPDGRIQESNWKAGGASWSDVEEHRPQNTGAAPFELIAVELKAPPSASGAEEAQIREVLSRFEQAWNARNAVGIAALFREDADQVLGSRRPQRGRHEIQRLWEGLDSIVGPGRRIALQIGAVRFLGPEAALVDVDGSFSGGTDERGRARGPGADRATFVMTRHEPGWQIAALRVYPAAAPAQQ